MAVAKKIKNTKSQEKTSRKTEAFYLFLIYPDYHSIKEEDVLKVKDQLSKLASKEKKPNFYLVIHSIGGSPYSAAKIVQLARSRCNNLISIVPIRAMSSATLMVLGTDSVVMGPESQLGPLDLPIEHPLIGGTWISALDVVRALTDIASSANRIAFDRYRDIRKEIGLSRNEAARIAYETATDLVRPVVEQLDPYQIQKCYRELRIGLTYARRFLSSYMMKQNPKQALSTSWSLVFDYPSHDYGILREEVKNKLKLKLIKSENFSQWEKIFSRTRKELKDAKSKKIFLSKEADL